MNELEALGWDGFFASRLEALDPAGSLRPARVSADGVDVHELAGGEAARGELAGRLRHELAPGERPVTGDWVAIEPGTDPARIVHVLERRTVLRRRAAGSESRAQVLAANVDVFLVVTSANRDLSPRRIERYLAAIWDGGASPVVLLNKVDLVADPAGLVERIEAVAPAVPVLSLSAQTGDGLDLLRASLGPGRTFGFVGSSGVGKSTLVNRLLGGEDQATRELRGDERGRHTTTRRQLVLVPGLGVLIDTPGMREMGVLGEGAGLASVFEEIAALAERCRFRDCEHDAEPGCAVRAAAEAGALAPERLASYRQLVREAAAARRRSDPVEGANAKRRWKAIHKQMRDLDKRR